MLEPISQYYYSHRLKLHFWDWMDNGKPNLILVHGSRDHARSWDLVAQAFCDNFRVVAPDLRGHGDRDVLTNGNENRGGNTMKRMIAALTIVAWGALSLALAHDPRTTAKDFSHGLKIDGAGELSFIYKAMHFNENTYKRMQSEPAFRERLNANVWSSIGSVVAEFEVGAGRPKNSERQIYPRSQYRTR